MILLMKWVIRGWYNVVVHERYTKTCGNMSFESEEENPKYKLYDLYVFVMFALLIELFSIKDFLTS